MINSDPAMTLNRCSSEAISPIVPIAVTTPCPRCGVVPLNVRSHLLFDDDDTILQHCEFYAVMADTVWVNAKACEHGDPTPFLRERLEAMNRESVSV